MAQRFIEVSSDLSIAFDGDAFTFASFDGEVRIYPKDLFKAVEEAQKLLAARNMEE